MIDRVERQHPKVSLQRLWFGVLAAPAAWGAAGIAAYLYSTATCRSRHLLLGSQAPDSAGFVGVFSVVMLVVAALGIGAALTSWRALSDNSSDTETWRGRSRFMALGGLFVSALFAAGIVLFAVPAFLVQPCSHIH